MDLSLAFPDVLVLVGTQTGNAELVAEDVAQHLETLGFHCHLTSMADALPETLLDYRQALVVMCTWSEGTPPDNAKDFVEQLDAVAPDLARLAFGVIALGDHAYDPYFCVAAHALAAQLAHRGGTCAHPTLEIDGTPRSEHYAEARAWATDFAQALAQRPA